MQGFVIFKNKKGLIFCFCCFDGLCHICNVSFPYSVSMEWKTALGTDLCPVRPATLKKGFRQARPKSELDRNSSGITNDQSSLSFISILLLLLAYRNHWSHFWQQSQKELGCCCFWPRAASPIEEEVEDKSPSGIKAKCTWVSFFKWPLAWQSKSLTSCYMQHTLPHT